MVDVLDTLPVFGLWRSFIAGIDWASRELHFNRTVVVSVFEATIRAVGGLVSAHAMALKTISRDGLYPPANRSLITAAEDLATRLMPAFVTQTEIPANEICLTNGLPFVHRPTTCTACAGTMLLEFGFLSAASRNCSYQRAAHRAMRALYERVRRDRMLPGRMLEVKRGVWVDNVADIGASTDSFYEYVAKAAIAFRDTASMDYWPPLYDAAVSQLQRPETGFYYQHDATSGSVVDVGVNALGAFWPGMQVLTGDMPGALRALGPYACVALRHGMLAEVFGAAGFPQVARSILRPELYESIYSVIKAAAPQQQPQPSGASQSVWAPPSVCAALRAAASALDRGTASDRLPPKVRDLVDAAVASDAQRAALRKAAGLCSAATAPAVGAAARAAYLRAPLGAPSVLYDVALRALQFLATRALTRCGLAQVDVEGGPPNINNRMESFVLAETLKYLYLVFDAEGGHGPGGDDGDSAYDDGPQSVLPPHATAADVAACLAGADTFDGRRACVPPRYAAAYPRYRLDDDIFLFSTEAHHLPLTAAPAAAFAACDAGSALPLPPARRAPSYTHTHGAPSASQPESHRASAAAGVDLATGTALAQHAVARAQRLARALAGKPPVGNLRGARAPSRARACAAPPPIAAAPRIGGTTLRAPCVRARSAPRGPPPPRGSAAGFVLVHDGVSWRAVAGDGAPPPTAVLTHAICSRAPAWQLVESAPPHVPPVSARDTSAAAAGATCAAPRSPFALAAVVAAARRRVHAPYAPRARPAWPPAHGVGVALHTAAVAAAHPTRATRGSAGRQPTRDAYGGRGAATHAAWMATAHGVATHHELRRRAMRHVVAHDGGRFVSTPRPLHGVTVNAAGARAPRDEVFASAGALRAARYGGGYRPAGGLREARLVELGDPLGDVGPAPVLLTGGLAASPAVPPRGGAYPLWARAAHASARAAEEKRVHIPWALAAPSADLPAHRRVGDVRPAAARMRCPHFPPVPTAAVAYLESLPALQARCATKITDRDAAIYQQPDAQPVRVGVRGANRNAATVSYNSNLMYVAPPPVVAAIAHEHKAVVTSAEAQRRTAPFAASTSADIVESTNKFVSNRFDYADDSPPAHPPVQLQILNLSTPAAGGAYPTVSMRDNGFPSYNTWAAAALQMMAAHDAAVRSPILGGRSRVAADAPLRAAAMQAMTVIQHAVAAALRCLADSTSRLSVHPVVHADVGLLPRNATTSIDFDLHMARAARATLRRSSRDVSGATVVDPNGEALWYADGGDGGGDDANDDTVERLNELWTARQPVPLTAEILRGDYPVAPRARKAFPMSFAHDAVVAAVTARPQTADALRRMPRAVTAALLAVVHAPTVDDVVNAATCGSACNITAVAVARLAMRAAVVLAEHPYAADAVDASGVSLHAWPSQQGLRWAVGRAAAVRALGLMLRTEHQAAAAFGRGPQSSYGGGYCEEDVDAAEAALAAAAAGDSMAAAVRQHDSQIAGVVRSTAVRVITTDGVAVAHIPQGHTPRVAHADAPGVLPRPAGHGDAFPLLGPSRCAMSDELVPPSVTTKGTATMVFKEASVAVGADAAPLPLSPHGLPAVVYRLPVHPVGASVKLSVAVVCGAVGAIAPTAVRAWRRVALDWLEASQDGQTTQPMGAWRTVLSRVVHQYEPTMPPLSFDSRDGLRAALIDTSGVCRDITSAPTPCVVLDSIYAGLARLAAGDDTRLPCIDSYVDPDSAMQQSRAPVDGGPGDIARGIATVVHATAAPQATADEDAASGEFEGTATSRATPPLDVLMPRMLESLHVGLALPTDACTPIDPEVATLWLAIGRGVAAIVARGGCSFETKAIHAAAAGAAAVIIVSGGPDGGEVLEMLRGTPLPADTVPPYTVPIPSVLLGPPHADRLVLRALALADAAGRATAAAVVATLRADEPLPTCYPHLVANISDPHSARLRAAHMHVVRGVDAKDRVLVHGGLMSRVAVELTVDYLRQEAYHASIPWLRVDKQRIDEYVAAGADLS